MDEKYAESFRKSLYIHFTHLSIFGCIISVALNSLLVIIGHTKTVNKSPILVLSLNSATTDCLVSIITAISLVVNSYIPVVLNERMDWCKLLILEIFTISSSISSAMHLLSLSLVHYKEIVEPLRYRAVIFCSQHRTRSIHLMSIICWCLPVLFFAIYFSSIVPSVSYGDQCKILIIRPSFQLIIVILFFIPLILMLFLYVRIFTTVEGNPGSVRSFDSKAVITTLLILSTYFISWMPVVVFHPKTYYGPYILHEELLDMKLRIIFPFIFKGLVILKAIVDPFIYYFRIEEIKIAINRSVLFFLGRFIPRTSNPQFTRDLGITP